MLNKCKVCEGTGYVDSGIKCNACNGKGIFNIVGTKKLCPICSGRRIISVQSVLKKAQIKMKCEYCFGTGFIDKV